jgi:cysteine desulfurase/selenocysteine lyase
VSSQAGSKPENSVHGLNAGDDAFPGVVSPAEVARIANELFNALPSDLQLPAAAAARVALPPNSAFTGNPYAAVPSPTVPAAPGLLASLTDLQSGSYVSTPDRTIAPDARSAVSVPAQPAGRPGQGGAGLTDAPFSFLADARPIFVEPTTEPDPHPAPSQALGGNEYTNAGFAAIPASLIADVQPVQLTTSPQPPAPAAPGTFDILDSSPVPAFSFLEDARPLFSGSIPGPVPATGVPDKPAQPEGNSSAANPFAAPLDRNAPQLPGTIAHAPDFRAPASGNFLNQSRPLDSAGAIPVVVPGVGQPELLADLGLSSYSFDVEAIRRDFPILRETVNGHPLIWLDNGATTQKPQSVIDRISYFYEHENSNVHRAAHELAARATDAYESAREKTRRFLNAGATREIVFVRGATEAINLVAQSWGRQNIQKDDEIVITWLEHHANIVPWQMLCAEKGARLRVAPVDDSGQVLLDEYEKLLGSKTRLVSITHVSNALGTIVPVKEMVEAAHRHGARVLVDGAQAVSHMRVDVQAINCDFYVFSGHKVFAPTGIGVVYGKSEVLDNMPPWQGGGNMIQDVTFEKTLYQPPPQRFEAGTGNIADAVGLGAAIDYLDRVGIANVSRHEQMLLTYATAALQKIPGLTIIGTAKEKAGVLSFVMDGFRTEEIGDYLNRKGIAVRGGHHCAQPILRRFGLESTLRATIALYNTCEEIDSLVAALWDLRLGRNPGLA